MEMSHFTYCADAIICHLSACGFTYKHEGVTCKTCLDMITRLRDYHYRAYIEVKRRDFGMSLLEFNFSGVMSPVQFHYKLFPLISMPGVVDKLNVTRSGRTFFMDPTPYEQNSEVRDELLNIYDYWSGELLSTTPAPIRPWTSYADNEAAYELRNTVHSMAVVYGAVIGEVAAVHGGNRTWYGAIRYPGDSGMNIQVYNVFSGEEVKLI